MAIRSLDSLLAQADEFIQSSSAARSLSKEAQVAHDDVDALSSLLMSADNGVASSNDQAEIDKTRNFAELVAVLQKSGVQINQQKNRLDTAVIPPELFQKISVLPAGEPFIVKVGDRAIASVIAAREDKPIVGDQARPIAADALRKEQGAKDMANRVSGLRKAAKIEYQKGFAPKKP